MFGATGIQGVTGPSAGPIGATGVGGPAGATCVAGATGAGSQGVTGAGSQGVTGAQGLTGAGIQGATGVSTVPGPTGAGVPGATGVQGQTGPGGTGSIGAQGTTGVQGQTGISNVPGPTGIQGQTGIQGNTGVQGITGNRGTVWFDGAGAPSGLIGQNGDFYIDNLTSNYYQKQGGSWIFQGTFAGATGVQGLQGITGAGIQGGTGVGAQGVTGSQGTTGVNGLGAIFLTGTGVPSNSIGIDGDIYIDTNTSNWYLKQSGSWVFQGTFLGATGVKGATGVGSPGAPGSTGVEGVTGPSGGVQGTTGVQGQTGLQGIQGTTGVQGQTGIQGMTGVQGITGLKGSTGVQGVTGGAAATVNSRYHGISNSSWSGTATVLYSTQDYDSNSAYNTSTGVWTCPQTGYYQIDAQVTFTSTGSDYPFQILINHNSTTVTQVLFTGPTSASTAYSMLVADMVFCSVNDTIKIQVENSSGTTNFINSAQSDFFSIANIAGIQGVTGPSGGQQGATGVQGVQGQTGSQGTTGVQGNTGVQGTTGVQGNTGVQGTTGVQGRTGIQGVTGATGLITSRTNSEYNTPNVGSNPISYTHKMFGTNDPYSSGQIYAGAPVGVYLISFTIYGTFSSITGDNYIEALDGQNTAFYFYKTAYTLTTIYQATGTFLLSVTNTSAAIDILDWGGPDSGNFTVTDGLFSIVLIG
jgi:hypothetical protein